MPTHLMINEEPERRPDETQAQLEIGATVVAIVPEFQQAHVRSDDGHLYAVTKKTPGVNVNVLKEGQHLRCTVTTSFLPRVLRARLVG